MASGNSTECTLDFGPAMSQFQSMFPDLSPVVIESVLRKHNGDVSLTIDDLLAITSKNCSSSSPSCSAQTSDFASSSSSANCQTVNVPAIPDKESQKSAPNCADDEKIALLIQNREFLKYLQQDPQFMREINSEFPSHSRRHRQSHHGHHRSSASARLLAASRPFDSPHNRCYNGPSYQNIDQADHIPPPAVPNGPIVDFSKGSIPNGPMVDCRKSTANWSQKLKSHLPLVNKSSSRNQTAGPQPTVAEMYAEEPPSSEDYIGGDEHLTGRLQNMSRNSKSLLLTLAKKFSLSKRAGGHDQSMRPTDFGDQSKDFSYQIHQN